MEPASSAVGETDRPRARSQRPLIAVALSLALVFACVAGLAAVSLLTHRQSIEAEARRSLSGLAHLLSQQLSTEADSAAAALEQLAAYSRRSGGPSSSGEAWIQTLSTALAGLSGVGSLTVTDSDGNVTFSTLTETMGGSYATSGIFSELAANPMNDRLVADPPMRSPVDGRWVLPVGRTNRTTSGGLDGVLIATIAPARLTAFYRSVDAGPGAIVWVLSPAGEVLLREPSAGNPMQEPWPSLPLDPSKPAAENTGIHLAQLDASGSPFLTAYETNDTGLTIAVSRPESEIFAPWRKEFAAALVGMGILGLALLAIDFGLVRTLRRKA